MPYQSLTLKMLYFNVIPISLRISFTTHFSGIFVSKHKQETPKKHLTTGISVNNQDFPLLNQIDNVEDLRKLEAESLIELAGEVRRKTIQAVSKTGGHLGAGLGVVELTIALHYVFNTPEDKLIWDVGHQTYPHKILTDRKNRIETLRQPSGLSGFTKRSESIFDPFGAGHSSTSISAALGMAVARDLNQDHFDVIAVIGDGAMSAGMAYEAMNNAGTQGSRLIVILNDNKMSIAPAVGAMSRYLSRLISSKPYLTFRQMAKQVVKHIPGEFIEKAARKAEQYTKDFWAGSNFFEEMGFYYVGPVDGHDLNQLIPIFKNIKKDKSLQHPILIHVVTEKGYGYHMPEAKKEKLHAVGKFDINTATQQKTKSSVPTYTHTFASTLTELAKHDPAIVAITAAMPSGTGLDLFAENFPTRCFDVGIAEQHAVTFAAGLACEKLKPFCAIYSTFLQRAYDQVVHDVAIQSLPVRFAIDRADLVGADGPTHAGIFDTTFLCTLPNFIVMAPSDEAELVHMITTMTHINDKPSAVRYPRGEGRNVPIPTNPSILPIGKGRIIQEGTDVAILSLGTRLADCQKAAHILKEQYNIQPTIADARFAKPLDTDLITQLAKNHRLLITIEGGAIGGFGSHVLTFLTDKNLICNPLKVHALCLPDYFIEQNNIDAMYQEARLDAESIVELTIRELGLTKS